MSTRNAGRAAWGLAAIEHGTPDYGQNGDDFAGLQTDAVDAITNILHALAERAEHEQLDEPDFLATFVLEAADHHFSAECEPDDIEASFAGVPYPPPDEQPHHNH